ncbi:hypothetical protein [Thermoanaerobacter uzonensis]|jgi:hypothetical protein|uniref:hypothetical protein n=1 Tax=Thermoanaerobacter uzonensis TaxID=447593 RepID=UPI00190E79B4|nr:hypothetical protein [Thermoanaerobacter uzonensis]
MVQAKRTLLISDHHNRLIQDIYRHFRELVGKGGTKAARILLNQVLDEYRNTW